MNHLSRILFHFIAVLGLGCAPQADLFTNLKQENIQISAPRSSATAGHLVQNVSQGNLLQFIERHPHTKVRPLYPEKGLYEVFTNRPEELPNARRNLFIKNDLQPKTLLFENCKLQTSELPHELVVIGSKQPNSPLTAYFEPPLDSTNHVIVARPRGSVMQQNYQFTEHFEFTPDQAGLYQIHINVIKKETDKEGRPLCWLKSKKIEIKANPVYNPNHQASRYFIKYFDYDPFWFFDKNIRSMSQKLGEGSLIALIDSGVNYNHLALAGSIKTNPREYFGNNFDDDANGFVDDAFGYDFVDQDNRPFDPIGHGSHLMGLMASPLFGVAPQAKVIPIRAFSYEGYDLGTLIASLYYAADQGAKIINFSASWEGDPTDANYDLLRSAIADLEKKEILLVTAAGNGDSFSHIGLDLAQRPYLPAAFSHTNIISVAATDENYNFTLYSNYSPEVVDLATLGGTRNKSLLSANMLTGSGGLWFESFGTSQAAAFVSGTLAKILSGLPKESRLSTLKQELFKQTETKDKLKDFTTEGRYLKVHQPSSHWPVEHNADFY